MAMMAARGLHGYSMPSHTSALNTFLGKPASSTGLMPIKKASQIAFHPSTHDKHPLYKQTVSNTQQRPLLKASTSTDLPEVASKENNKENVDPLSFLRSQFRFQTPAAAPSNARPTSSGGYKRKFEMDPTPAYRQPLKDITAEVLQRDYKVKMTSRNEATRVPSYYPPQSTPFQFAPSTAASKLERPIRQPTSPRKKASQPATLPFSSSSSSFTFDKTLNKIVSSSLGGVPQMKPFVQPTVQQPVMRTSVKKDHLFDMRVQLGLLKPTAEQLKLKAPSTPFAAPRQMQTMDFFGTAAAKKKSSSRSFALGRI